MIFSSTGISAYYIYINIIHSTKYYIAYSVFSNFTPLLHVLYYLLRFYFKLCFSDPEALAKALHISASDMK